MFRWLALDEADSGIQALRLVRYILTGLDAVPAMVEPGLSSREITGGVGVDLSRIVE